MQTTAALVVLIVDDESLMRWSLGETLAAEGHTVLEAADGRSALEALTQTRVPIDVVMLDQRLPDTTGLDLLVLIRKVSPRSKVVLMTAYGTPEVMRAAHERGAVCQVHKPIEIDQVRELIARALATSSTEES
jgi:two-component system response regulator (stage 0 sporulation protein F)